MPTQPDLREMLDPRVLQELIVDCCVEAELRGFEECPTCGEEING